MEESLGKENVQYLENQRVVFLPAKGVAVMATVRCVFDCEHTAARIVGLELHEDGHGKHDGVYSHTEKRYFTCPPNRGLFVRHDTHRIRPVEAAERARSAVRKLSLALEAIEELEALRLAQIGQQAEVSLLNPAEGLEEGGPDSLTKNPKSLRALVNVMRARRVIKCFAAVASEKQSDDAVSKPSSEALHPDLLEGGGPVLRTAAQGIVTPQEAQDVFAHCGTAWRVPLRCSTLLALVQSAKDLVLKEPTVNRLQVAENGKLTVFGDLHGHLKDLLHVWRREGLPGPGCVYLFNGDLCDRGDVKWRGGSQSLHIWACILSFKLAYPDCVYINRGNHEDGSYWCHAGAKSFRAEIMAKYSRAEAELLIDAFTDLCECLPLCTVIDGRCLVAHGGLPRFWKGAGGVRLAEIDRMERPIPALDPYCWDRAAQTFLDLTWADPWEHEGTGKSSRGERFVTFGPNITEAFLKKEGLGLLLRSHQVPGEKAEFDGKGFEWWHRVDGSPVKLLSPEQQGLCLTVFTASDYCGGSNNGAVVVFTGNVSRYSIVEHTAVEAEVTLLGAASGGQLLRENQSMSYGVFVQELIEVIVRKKHQLLEEFQEKDTSRDWHLPVSEFLDCCKRVIPHVEWEDLLKEPTLVPLREGKVCYTEFLTRYQLTFANRLGKHSGFRRILGSKLFEAIASSDHTLEQTLGALDPNGDGCVTSEELGGVLSRFGKLLPRAHGRSLYRTAIASEGHVRVEDFLGRLSLHFSLTVPRPTTPENEFVPALLDVICRDIVIDEAARGGSDSVAMLLRRFFERADADGSGFLEHAEFVTVLKELPSSKFHTEAQLLEVARYVDLSGNGSINYPELLCAMYVSRDTEDAAGFSDRAAEGAHARLGPGAFLEDGLEAVYRVLNFDYAAPILGILRQLDPPGTTRCSKSTFEETLVLVNNGLGGAKLSRTQIKCLVESLDLDHSELEEGELDFEDFFSSFQITDTKADTHEHAEVE